MSREITVSIVTPTYNRGYLLHKCFDSLLAQTDRDFEWIIVDDGSSDDTETVVRGFEPADFPIIYIKKENGGKHTALNASHPHIHGKYVLILDSDDYLTAGAVAEVKKGWALYDTNEAVGMVTFLKGNPDGEAVCKSPTPGQLVEVLRHKRVMIHSMDCCEVVRAELFKKYPFPVFEGERFLSECALWNRVGRSHKCVYINEVVYICEYLEGGLTDSGRAMRIRNPKGGMFICDLRMGSNNFLSQRIKYGLLYTCYGYFDGRSGARIYHGSRNKALTLLCLLPGYAIYRRWKKTYLK